MELLSWFDGVVGYHVRLTLYDRERSRVRASVESIFLVLLQAPPDSVTCVLRRAQTMILPQLPLRQQGFATRLCTEHLYGPRWETAFGYYNMH